MEYSVMLIEQKKRIALVAHDNKKQDLLDWARWNRSLLIEHELTGSTRWRKMSRRTATSNRGTRRATSSSP
jgi:methylglyoxal synthase